MTKNPDKCVFIDGEAGTTGLEIRNRLKNIPDLKILSLAPDKRKDLAARLEIMQQADLVILCLPDEAAKEAVQLADRLEKKDLRILDASTAHRVAKDWVYGFAEMDPKQSQSIQKSFRVSNPGCYPTGVIALLRPLVNAGILPQDYPITINAISGYSGGGKSMIETYEPIRKAPNFELYALGLNHKHLPEIMTYTGLKRRPIFVPSVGNFRQGMLVSIPLHLDTLPSKPKLADIQENLATTYKTYPSVRVLPLQKEEIQRIEPEHLNHSDDLELFVCGCANHPHAVLVARLDNLGKGAAGSAVQNITLMLGLHAGSSSYTPTKDGE